MATLIFDIETAAFPLDAFDDVQREFLFREAEKLPAGEAREARRAELARQLSLYPLTAQVVCVAMLNADTRRGQVLHLADDFAEDAGGGPVKFTPLAEEAELLGEFWDTARKYDHVVTFNGRGFDVPFLYLRSAILDVPVTRKDWLGYRFATEPHCDLAEQFTFYNVSGRDGAARRFNLDFYCKVFGLPSPKAAGVTGLDVVDLLAAGRHREIAEYCLRDVQATLELHRLWRERLAGIK
jgi:hypothetical protein